MRFSVTLLTYIVTFLLSLGLPSATFFAFRKKCEKFHFFHFLVGMVAFIICAVPIVLLLATHLTSKDNISNYNVTTAYKLTLIGVILSLIVVLFVLFVHRFFIAGQRRGALSFAKGMGFGGVAAIGLYALMMLVMLVVQYFSSTLEYFDAETYVYVFSNETYISVFSPLAGHVSLAIIFVAIYYLFVFFADTMMAFYKEKVKLYKKILILAAQGLCIVIAWEITIYMRQLSVAHWAAALICGFLCGISLLLRALLPVFAEKDQAYVKQFD